MTTTTVFRVAHSTFVNPESGTHFGPYATFGLPADKPYINCDMTENHPHPSADGLGWLDSDEVCGFASLDAYLSWFDAEHEVQNLSECNFHLQVWEVPSMYVRFGDKQAAFLPSEGRIVDTMPL